MQNIIIIINTPQNTSNYYTKLYLFDKYNNLIIQMHPSIFTKLYIINLILSEPQTHQGILSIVYLQRRKLQLNTSFITD